MFSHAQTKVKTDDETERKTNSKPIGFQFVAFPVEILRRDDISPAAKLLLAVLMDSVRGNRSGLCKLCNATLGARIGRSASEVGRHLAELEAAGIIWREFGESKRIRLGVGISWVPEIPATSESTSTRSAQPGSRDPRNPVHGGSATIQSPPSDLEIQTGPILSTLGEEKTSADPKPTPTEIAECMRAMIAGTYAPTMFDAKPSPAPTPPAEQAPAPGSAPTAPPAPRPMGRPHVRESSESRSGFAWNPAMTRRVGYSAVAALQRGKPPRVPIAEQLAELRRRTAERERAASSGVAIDIAPAPRL